MLGPSMMHRVGGEVDRRDVIAVDHCGTVNRTRQLLKQLTKPGTLSDGVGHHTILSLSTGARDRRLPPGRPRDK